MAVTDDEAVNAFEYLSRTEGIVPAIESAHAVAYAMKLEKEMKKEECLVINLSGRGNQASLRDTEEKYMSNIRYAFEKGKAFIPFITCGDPSLDVTEELVLAMEEAGADLIELQGSYPFSDPTATVPVIQEANLRALSGGVTTDDLFLMVRRLRKRTRIPLVFMTYANVVFSYGNSGLSGHQRKWVWMG